MFNDLDSLCFSNVTITRGCRNERGLRVPVVGVHDGPGGVQWGAHTSDLPLLTHQLPFSLAISAPVLV